MPDTTSDNSNTAPISPDPDAKPWFDPIVAPLDRIAEYSERAREKNAPIIIDFTTLKNTQSFHTRLRMIGFVFCADTAADHVRVSFGGRPFDFLLDVGTTEVVFPYEVDRGIDIVFANITNPDHTSYMYIIAYTE